MNESADYKVSGNIVDVVKGRIFPGTLHISNGRVASVTEEHTGSSVYIMPGLVDAHIHIESSMLLPSEFARLAVVHGTVATVSDPHEIANVLGIEGVKFMIANGKKVPFRFHFGAPSCVPATGFESSGASLGVNEVETLLEMKEVGYLSEMMNFPGVLFEDPEVMAKIAAARKRGKAVDGHSPGLSGEGLVKYVEAGITTDHECFTMEEALEKISLGMKILIREGSAARNFDTLAHLVKTHPSAIMFCSDDKHPDELAEGHINLLVRRGIRMGFEFMPLIRCCTLNPVMHYGLDAGLLRKGDPADFITVDNLTEFNILSTTIGGERVAAAGETFIPRVDEDLLNVFKAGKIEVGSLGVKPEGKKIRVIEAYEGQLITGSLLEEPKILKGNVVSDTERDILKMVVLNRYREASPAIGFVKNFGLREGALASTVAHDSHNIIAVGVSDADIAKAINLVIAEKGGIAVVAGKENHILPLPVAGLMSASDGYEVAARYHSLNRQAIALGSPLQAPFMTLSFMALLVIPALKLSDKGLFDGSTFTFTGLFE